LRLDCFRNLTGAVHSEIQGEKKGIFYLIHALIVQYGDEWPDFGFGHGLHMIEINSADFGQTIIRCQDDFAGNMANRGGDRGDGHFTQNIQNECPASGSIPVVFCQVF